MSTEITNKHQAVAAMEITQIVLGQMEVMQLRFNIRSSVANIAQAIRGIAEKEGMTPELLYTEVCNIYRGVKNYLALDTFVENFCYLQILGRCQTPAECEAVNNQLLVRIQARVKGLNRQNWGSLNGLVNINECIDTMTFRLLMDEVKTEQASDEQTEQENITEA